MQLTSYHFFSYPVVSHVAVTHTVPRDSSASKAPASATATRATQAHSAGPAHAGITGSPGADLATVSAPVPSPNTAPEVSACATRLASVPARLVSTLLVS